MQYFHLSAVTQHLHVEYSCRRSKKNIADLKLVEKKVQICIISFGDGAHKKLYDALFGTLRTAFEAICSKDDGREALKNYSSIFEKLFRIFSVKDVLPLFL